MIPHVDYMHAVSPSVCMLHVDTIINYLFKHNEFRVCLSEKNGSTFMRSLILSGHAKKDQAIDKIDI